MSKLRVVQPRAPQPGETTESPNDLRGLGDAELFNQSGFSIHLIVSHPRMAPPREELRSIVETYGLKPSTEETKSGECRFEPVWKKPGEHKTQALKVFFAAMEIHRAYPAARVYVAEKNDLKQLLADRIPGAVDHAEFEKKVHAWSKGHGRFTLDASVTVYLNQAGVPVATSETPVHLDASQLNTIHERLVAPVTQPMRARKAG